MTIDEAKKVLEDCPPDMHCCDACFLDERCQAEVLLTMHVEDLERQNEELQKDAICALARVPRWISVEERLPEYNEYVLCRYTDFDGMKWDTVGRFCEWNHLWDLDIAYDHDEEKIVTHWMPLPEPPEEGAE